jgi:predicted HTH transcriptional regulator
VGEDVTIHELYGQVNSFIAHHFPLVGRMDRDYFITAPIRLLIFSDRVEIISPGRLPNHLDIEQIRFGVSNLRNPALASHAFYMLPYRGLGSGIPRATEAWSDIELIDDRRSNQFKVVIRRLEVGDVKSQPESQPESLESRVLRILANKPANKAEISAQLGQKVVSGQLNRIVRDLLAARIIEFTIPDKPNSRLQQYRLCRL